MSATILGIVDNREQSVPGRKVHVALVVLCGELSADQSKVREWCVEVEGNIFVSARLLLHHVLKGVFVHGITELPWQDFEE